MIRGSYERAKTVEWPTGPGLQVCRGDLLWGLQHHMQIRPNYSFVGILATRALLCGVYVGAPQTFGTPHLERVLDEAA